MDRAVASLFLIDTIVADLAPVTPVNFVVKSISITKTFLVLLFLCAPSCTSNVAYWEKSDLADPVMSYQDDGTLSHFEHKVFQSIEGAAGGFGASAGGGCGCN